MRCAAITRAGERCRLDATHGSYCYQHAPETAEERRRNARKGGKAGGNSRPGLSEITEAKSWIRGLVSKLLKGEVDRDIATACFMGLNVLARYIELERHVRETDELAAEIEELKREYDIAG
jgi:hypothetical protein